MIKLCFFSFTQKRAPVIIITIIIYIHKHIYNLLIEITLALNVYDLIMALQKIILRTLVYEI